MVVLIDNEFYSGSECEMKVSDGTAPQCPFPCVQQQHHLVREICFQFQRYRPAIDESILALKRRPVRQQFVTPPACFISGKSRAADRKKEGLGSIRQKFQIVTAFSGKLRFGNIPLLIPVLLAQILRTEYPAVPVFGVGRKPHTDIIVSRLFDAIYKTSFELHSPHTRQVALGVCLPHKGKQRYNYK